MPEDNSGGNTPPRPGMNVGTEPPRNNENSVSGFKNNSAKRRRRRKKAESDIQATAGETVSSPGGPQLSSSGGLISPKNSKRRRRRRGKRHSSPGDRNDSVGGGSEKPSGKCAVDQTKVNSFKDDNISGLYSTDQGAFTDTQKRTNRGPKRRRTRRPGAKPIGKIAAGTDTAHTTGEGSVRATARSVSSVTGINKPASRTRKPFVSRAPDAYAALDLGTNNCRLLVAVPQQPGRFRVVDAFSRIVRLGEGLATTGRLNDEAMDRAVGALKVCAGKLENRAVRGVRLIATEACRSAENGAEFLKRVEHDTGLKLEIVDRETEARLAVAGCASLIDRTAKGVVLFDIGGGSSELALLDLRKRRSHDLGKSMVSWTSLPVGVVTLSEKHGGGKDVTRSVFDAMVGEVAAMLQDFKGRKGLEAAAREGEVHLLGTSGTVTTLAGIHLKLPRYDRRQVDGIWMASSRVDAMIDTLVEMSFEQRVQNPCIGEDRADLVLAGCAILVAIQRLWPCPRLRVADRGLREGLLTEMMNRDNAWQRRAGYFGAGRKMPQGK